MADYTYRANLSAKDIPVDPLLFGRSVVIKDRDNNYAPNLASKADSDKDIGIPQVLYISNCLPTDYGYYSIGLFGSLETCPGTPYIAFPIRSATETALLVHTTEGHLYRLKKDSESSEVPQFVYVGTYAGKITYAHVAGITYIYVSGLGCYKYDFTTKTLVSVTLAGLTPSAILGVTATGGYLLAWSADAIAWSSLVNPEDFVPSLDTGAGGGSVEGAKGAITVCVANSYGVYIFTENNCIYALLSNNARFPFNFKEIVGSSGLDSIQAVSYEGNQNAAYAFTNAGFQQITNNGAKVIWTDLYECGANSPVWNENTVLTNSPIQGVNGTVQGAKIVCVASKYLCVSILKKGTDYYNQCWVYDISLDRWGRIVKDHREIFEDESFNIGIITTDNRYLFVENPFYETTHDREPDVGYIAMGKYQHSRQRHLVLLAIEPENLYPLDIYGTYPSVYVLSSLDGKSGSFVQCYRDDAISASYARYLIRSTGVNHTVLIKGHFYLNSLVLTYCPGGNR